MLGPGQRCRCRGQRRGPGRPRWWDATVEAQFDARTDKHLLRIGRRHHGNIKASVVTQDFLHGADYAALKEAGLTFKGLLGNEAIVRRGEG